MTLSEVQIMQSPECLGKKLDFIFLQFKPIGSNLVTFKDQKYKSGCWMDDRRARVGSREMANYLAVDVKRLRDDNELD